MTSLLFILSLMTAVEKQADLPAEKQKQNTQTPVPDADVLLFLAEWSDENDQWLDPELFDQNPEVTEILEKHKVSKNEQDPHID